jgi:putative ABC transport system permease protein
MRYLPLLWAGVWRNPAETLLTWLATTIAFALFSLMVGLYVHTQRLIDEERMDRLYVVTRYPEQPPRGLPVALAGQIAHVSGVTGVGTVHWLNGYHGDSKNPASVMAVDEGIREGWPELHLSLAQRRRLFATPSGAFASHKAAARWHLQEGDTFQITTPRDPQADGNPTRNFRVLGFIGDVPERNQGLLVGNYHYVDNSEARQRQGLGNMFYVAIVDAARANQVCRDIDQRFANSGTPTYCVPMRSDAQAMANSSVNIAALTLSVAGAGLFMVLFLVANGIARSVSERVPELAVLQAVGFRHRHLGMLVALEASVPCLLGALLGAGAAYTLNRSSIHLFTGNLGRLLTASELPPAVLALALGFAVLLAAGSSIVPILKLRTLRVVDAIAGR